MNRKHKFLSVVRQCALLDISRSSLYYQPVGVSREDEELMKLTDRQYLATIFYGSWRMTVWLRRIGHQVNRKRVQRLMRTMGLQAIYRRPRTSRPAKGHKVYPYLLRGMGISRPDQVWAADITYVPMAYGHLYLVAVMDWHSRYVVAWRLSNTLEVDFCVEALKEALGKACPERSRRGRPEIFTTDQGAQFTSEGFTGLLEGNGTKISMDGRGRYLDNVFIERLWRTVKYEEIYLKAYETVREAKAEIGAYLGFYNTQRPHQALGYRTPAEVYDTEGDNMAAETEARRTSLETLVGYAATAGPSLNSV